MNQDPKAPVIYGETIEAGNKPVSHRWRAKVAAWLTCLSKFRLIVPLDSGDGIAVPTAADVRVGVNGMVVTLPALRAGAAVYPGGGSPSGWLFPTAIKYDVTKTYKKGNVVYVDIFNSANGDGQSWPGIWVATQDVPVPSAAKHYPHILYNPDSDGKITNFDSANNYWMPVASIPFMFRITTLSNADYFKAKTWDGTTLGSVEFTIAKPPNARTSLSTEVVDGVTLTYSSYTADISRVATDGTNTETEKIYPRYIASGSNNQDVIYAELCFDGTGVSVSGTPLFWLEKNWHAWVQPYA